MATVTKKSGMIVLPTRISHVLVEATNEPRVDIALNIVINDFLERRLEEAIKRLKHLKINGRSVLTSSKNDVGMTSYQIKAIPTPGK